MLSTPCPKPQNFSTSRIDGPTVSDTRLVVLIFGLADTSACPIFLKASIMHGCEQEHAPTQSSGMQEKDFNPRVAG